MCDYSGCTPVVAVRINKPLVTMYRICIVPNGACLSDGNVVLFGVEDSDYTEKGVCVSDVLFLADDVLKMACCVTGSKFNKMPIVRAKIIVERFDGGREDIIEQTLL